MTAAAGLPFPGSLCHQCAHHRLVEGARTVFIRCEVLVTKYPPQPVRSCPVFTAREEEGGGGLGSSPP